MTRRPPPIRSLELILTAACNLKCAYCYQDRHQDRRMSLETARAAVDRLLATPGPDKTILFYGGEPLLEFPLIEQVVAYTRERKGRRRVSFGITTNGTRLVPRVVDFLAEHDFRAHLSFDGVPAAQDVRGRGTFVVLDGVLRDIAARHPDWFARRVRVQSTLTPASVDALAESIDYFLARGVADLVVYPSIRPDEGWIPARFDELRSQIRRAADHHLRQYRETGKIPWRLFRGGAGFDPPPPDQATCGAGEGRGIAVDVDGTASGCVLFAGSYQAAATPWQERTMTALRLGPIDASDFSERHRGYPAAARATHLFHGKENKYSSFARCADCRYVGSCSVCPMSIGRMPGVEDPNRIPDFLCAFNLLAHEERDRFVRRRIAVDAAARRRARTLFSVPATPRDQELLEGIDRALGIS